MVLLNGLDLIVNPLILSWAALQLHTRTKVLHGLPRSITVYLILSNPLNSDLTLDLMVTYKSGFAETLITKMTITTYLKEAHH